MVGGAGRENRLILAMERDEVSALKFTPLVPPAGFVPRPQLSQAIARGLRGRLVLMVAPPGYGKTALLSSVASEWSRFAGDGTFHLAWYRLDPSDDDAALFVARLVEAVRRVVPGFGGVARAALQEMADVRGELRRSMALFQDELRRLEPERVFLVLDGLHYLTDPAIVEALEQALLDSASPLRLIAATQTDPHLYLSALRSQDALVELRTEDLRWNPEELRRLTLQRVGGPLSQGALDDLMRVTGGWPSAANLASLILARDLSSQSFMRLAPTEHGYAVLLRELLSGLPTERREAALRTSLLARLDPSSCLDGVGVEDPEAFLRFLEGSGLPVVKPVGSDLPLYYEPLFRTALQQELARQLLPQEYRDLQRRVASFYAATGKQTGAIPGYLQIGDHEEAAALLERALEAETSPRALDLPLRWLRGLPAAVRERHPGLMVQEARLLLSRERLDEARVLLVAAQPGLEASGDGRSRGQQLLGWATVRLLEGRYPVARDSAREALEQLPEEDDYLRSEAFSLEARALEYVGDLSMAFSLAAKGLLEAERSGRPPLVVRALLQLGKLAYLRGDYIRALALTGRAFQRAALLGTEIVPLSEVGGMAASAYLERGQLQEALVVAESAREAGEKLRDQLGRLRARLALAATLEQMGQGRSSEENLSGALGQTLELPERRPERTLALQRAAAILLRRRRRKEGLERAQQALEAAVSTSHQPLIDQSRLMVAVGEMVGLRTVAVLARIRRLNDDFNRSDDRRWLSAGHRLLAQGYGQLGLRRRARSHLRSSLALAAEQSYAGMPLGLPSRRERLLLLAVRGGVAHETAGALLGVDAADARKWLDSLLRQKDPQLRSWAEQALKGVEAGLGKVPPPRLAWPGSSPEGAEAFPKVALHSLGDFLGSTGGQPVEWPSVDARTLAAYLLVRRTAAVPRDRVLQEAWPDEDPAIANVRLHEALYRVREALGPGYPAVDPSLDGEGVYRWDGMGCSIDAEQFRDTLRRVRLLLERENPPVLSAQVVSLLEEAVRLYQGEFLAGFAFGWCEAPREDLRELLLWTTRLLVDHYMALHRWRDAIRHGLKSLKSDPIQEDVVRDLMVCYFRVGQRGAVDHRYRELKRLLARERGVWPSEETRGLRLKLLGNGAGWARGESMPPSVLVVGK